MFENKIIITAIIFFLVGLFIGHTWGYISALNWCTNKALYLLEHQGMELKVNEGLIAAGLWAYRNRIDNCVRGYLEYNASIHDITGD